MTEAALSGALQQWMPPPDGRVLETCVAVTPAEFRRSAAIAATNIFGTLGFARFRETYDDAGRQTWQDYVCAVDEASFHAGMAVVFVRQLLELGKERVPVQSSAPHVYAPHGASLAPWNIDQAGDDSVRRAVVTRGFELAQCCHSLRSELDLVADWSAFTVWATNFLQCGGALVSLGAEVCAHQWIAERSDRNAAG